MKSPDDYLAINVNMQQVHQLMSYVIPQWVSKTINHGDGVIMDTVHACTAEEQHKLMLVFPNEVLAYSLFMMSRNAHFMDLLIGKKNSGELDRLLDRLKEIRDAEEKAGDTEDSERKAVH